MVKADLGTFTSCDKDSVQRNAVGDSESDSEASDGGSASAILYARSVPVPPVMGGGFCSAPLASLQRLSATACNCLPLKMQPSWRSMNPKRAGGGVKTEV